VTVVLVTAVSAAIMGLILFLSGRAYVRERSPLLIFLGLFHRYDQGALSSSAVLAALMPALANICLFIPWGFLVFLALDRPERARWRTHLITTTFGLLFAVALAAWQAALPTRVTSWYDVPWHALGALTGSLAGYLRKRVHIRFG
jgi:VanZ family protein